MARQPGKRGDGDRTGDLADRQARRRVAEGARQPRLIAQQRGEISQTHGASRVSATPRRHRSQATCEQDVDSQVALVSHGRGYIDWRRAGWRARRRRARSTSTRRVSLERLAAGAPHGRPGATGCAARRGRREPCRTVDRAGRGGCRSSDRRRAADDRWCSAGRARHSCGSPPHQGRAGSGRPSIVPIGWSGDTPTMNGSSMA